mgnify:CR=1 FL=1
MALSSGKTLRDTSVTLGLIEHNIAGKGTRLRGQGSYSERGPNLLLSLTEHAYSPSRWAKEYLSFYSASGFRFKDESSTWTRNRAGGHIEWISPFSYTSRLQYEFALLPYYEWNSKRDGPHSTNEGFHGGGLPFQP